MCSVEIKLSFSSKNIIFDFTCAECVKTWQRSEHLAPEQLYSKDTMQIILT